MSLSRNVIWLEDLELLVQHILATGSLCLESVVALNFRFYLQHIPSFLRIRLIRQMPTLHAEVGQIMLQSFWPISLASPFVSRPDLKLQLGFFLAPLR